MFSLRPTFASVVGYTALLAALSNLPGCAQPENLPATPTTDASLPPDAAGTATTTDTSTPRSADTDTAPPATGDTVTPACSSSAPHAVISVAEVGPVPVGTVLHLSGADSCSPNGPITGHIWNHKPVWGPTDTFAPSVMAPEPTLVTQVPGPLSICLLVEDATGAWSPKPTCTVVTVVAQPTDLRIELSWSAAGGGSAGPGGGGPALAGRDLDLHLAHPFATGPDRDCDGQPDPWFHSPFDLYPLNPHPNWGKVNPAVNDDPSLVTDGVDESTPEIVVWDAVVPPADPLSLGVHFWHDNGLGPAEVDLKVWQAGALVLDVSGVVLQPGDMWTVARLHFPSATPPGQPGGKTTPKPPTVCFQQGAPCNTDAPGQRWTATGAPCITPCYGGPALAATLPGGQASAMAAGCAAP